MITPPFNPQGDRLLLPDAAVAKLRALQERRADLARGAARAAVSQKLGEWLDVSDLEDGGSSGERLVDAVLELVQTAVLADRARQREVVREVQANLPAWAALGQAAPAPPSQDS